MDLKDRLGWVPLLTQAHGEVLRVSRQQGLAMPRQTRVAVRDTDLISNVEVVPAGVLGRRASAGRLDPEDAFERMRRRLRRRGC